MSYGLRREDVSYEAAIALSTLRVRVYVCIEGMHARVSVGYRATDLHVNTIH